MSGKPELQQMAVVLIPQWPEPGQTMLIKTPRNFLSLI
jgi:hypothetical protein